MSPGQSRSPPRPRGALSLSPPICGFPCIIHHFSSPLPPLPPLAGLLLSAEARPWLINIPLTRPGWLPSSEPFEEAALKDQNGEPNSKSRQFSGHREKLISQLNGVGYADRALVVPSPRLPVASRESGSEQLARAPEPATRRAAGFRSPETLLTQFFASSSVNFAAATPNKSGSLPRANQ